MPHTNKPWSKLQLGDESIWVARNTYKFLDKANAEIASPAPTIQPVSA